MVGLGLTLVFCVLTSLCFCSLLKKWTEALDPAEQLGFSGLVGLGLVGTLTVMVGLLPGGLNLGIPVIAGAVAVFGIFSLVRKRITVSKPSLPKGGAALILLGLVVAGLFPLVGALSPSTTLDWDSLAYHLAVPKIWLQAGQVIKVETIHHSNFPFATDALYLYGLKWGGESGAKAFSLAIFILGAMTLFGHARRRFGDPAGWWAAAAFAGSPVVLWESGTAYIDVSHGLFAGMGVLYAAELVGNARKQEPVGSLAVLAGLGLGLGMGTKFTGIQTFVLAGLVALVFLGKDLKKAAKPIGLVVAVAACLAVPWFAKTAAFTGNPVFPFFYEKLGGQGWNQWRADIYRNEQQTFGVGRTEAGRDVTKIGDAILGLAYLPGRYTNPGQTEGGGFPIGAIGFLTLGTFLVVAASGKASREDKYVLAWAALSLVAWFFLTQQSRYLTFLVVPAAVMLAGQTQRGAWARLFAGLCAIQLAYTVWVVAAFQGQDQMRALFSGEPDAYRLQTTAFVRDSAVINGAEDVTKVAMYDQVFGFLLDKPYVWANPGHSGLFDPSDAADAPAFIAKFKAQQVSHIYLSFTAMDKPSVQALLTRMGLGPEGNQPDKSADAAMMDNPDLKWKVLLADAVLQGLAVPEGETKSGLLLRLP